MRILIFLTIILFLTSCTTVKVAREVTKAGNSIKNSVDNIIENNREKKTNEDNDSNNKNNTDESLIKNEKKKIEEEKKLESKKIKEQQKQQNKVKFIGKKLDEVELLIGKPNLIRLDGNSKVVRFDSLSCRIFLFFKSKTNSAKIEYFEIRNLKGDIIIRKDFIKKCYQDLKLI